MRVGVQFSTVLFLQCFIKSLNVRIGSGLFPFNSLVSSFTRGGGGGGRRVHFAA